MKRFMLVQQHPEVKNLWTKEGRIHALLHNGKTVKVTEGNLKIMTMLQLVVLLSLT